MLKRDAVKEIRRLAKGLLEAADMIDYEDTEEAFEKAGMIGEDVANTLLEMLDRGDL